MVLIYNKRKNKFLQFFIGKTQNIMIIIEYNFFVIQVYQWGENVLLFLRSNISFN